MKIGKLTRDPALVPTLQKKPTTTQQAENKGRAEFVLARARVAPAANPTWQGSDRDDVKAANQAALKALVKTEVTVAATKLTKLKTAMADTTKTELVGVDAASIDPPQAAAGKKARLALRYASPSPRRLRPGMPSHFDGVEMWVRPRSLPYRTR